MTDNRPEVDEFAEELRRQMDASLRPTVDKVLDDAKRPYRRMIFWLLLGYGILLTASVLQWVLVR